MATYDVHQHLWPESFIAALEARERPPFLTGSELVTSEGRFELDLGAHAVATRLRVLDADEVDVAVLCLQPSLGLELLEPDECLDLEETWVEGMREVVAASAGRFVALSPSRPRDGFAGASVGSSVLVELHRETAALDAAALSDVLVFVHPDASGQRDLVRPAWWEWVVGYPARMQAAYLSWLAFGRERWPTLRVLFAMLAGGGPFQLERLARRGVDVRSALDPHVYFDVSSHGRRAIELCIETFGVNQLAYGSDTPVIDPKPTLDAVRGFGDAVTHVLQTDTPSSLLK
jgi:6-methylsalicylate decarboxylase